MREPFLLGIKRETIERGVCYCSINRTISLRSWSCSPLSEKLVKASKNAVINWHSHDVRFFWVAQGIIFIDYLKRANLYIETIILTYWCFWTQKKRPHMRQTKINAPFHRSMYTVAKLLIYLTRALRDILIKNIHHYQNSRRAF